MILDDPVTAIERHVLAVSGTDMLDKLLRCGVLEVSKDNKALRIVACDGLAFGRPFSETKIQLQFGTCLDQIKTCDVLNIAHYFGNQVCTDNLVAF